MHPKTVSIFLLLLLASITCAPTYRWTSLPPQQTAGDADLGIQLEALKKDHPFYVMFKISVQNKSDSPVLIDWNRTRYIHNGRSTGGFAFKGITPEDIRNGTISPDKIPAGAALVKEIAPVKLVAWSPVRDRSVTEARPGISPGQLPAGENGVHLVAHRGGREIRQEVTVELVAEKQ